MPETASSPFFETRQATAQVELDRRLRAGDSHVVESLLESFPEVAADADAVLELIYAEYAISNQLGRSLPLEHWYGRFPDQRDRLERLFGFHELMTDQETWNQQTTATLNDHDKSSPVGAIADHPPGYELLDEIGRGGMAMVYRAKQLSLNRIVAVKVLRGSTRIDADQRLRDEAMLAARLQHPNIVQVIEVGDWRGSPFLAMEWVPGRGLDAVIAKKGINGLEINQTAALVESLARTIAFAHQNGVIHRDLKPSNVLVGRELELLPAAHGPLPTLKIADFGLAVFQDPAGSLQHSITVSGTPCYMAPEQAEGRSAEIGPRSDVYGLGGLLYELLTGRPPFQAATVAETLDLVRHCEPIPPRQLRAQTPSDLETICLKCLRKSPDERYESAEAMADDLHRFQNNRPILARPVSTLERGIKWVRRHRVIAGLATALLIAVLTTLGAFAAKHRSGLSAKEKEQTLNAELQKTASEKLIGSARSQWNDGRLDAARQTLDQCPGEYRNSEWKSLYHLCHAEVARWTGVQFTAAKLAVSPDGSILAYRRHTAPRSISLIDAKTGESLGSIATGGFPLQVEFSEDGQSVVVLRQMTEVSSSKATATREHEVTVWDLQRKEPRLNWPVPENGATISRWAKRVAAADGQLVRVWDGTTGKLVAELAEPFDRKGRPQIAVDDAATTLAISVPAALHVWNITTGQMENSIARTPGLIGGLVFRRGGAVLFGSAAQSNVTAEEAVNRRAIVGWNVAAGQRNFDIPAHVLAIYTLSPDGRHLAYLKSNTIELHDAHTGKHLATLRGHTGTIYCLAFSADSRRLYSSGADNTLRTWNTEPWRE